MKIIIASNTFGIVYKFRKELVERLIEEKNEVYILSPNENEKFYIEELKKIGANIVETPMDRRGMSIKKDIILLKTYLKAIKEISPDVVLTYTIKPNIYASIACQILKIRYINSVTGIGTGFQKNGFLKKIVINLHKIAFKKSEKVFFQNTSNLKIFLDNKIISDTKKYKLVNGSGVNLERFSYLEDLENLDKKIKKFLFIGRIMDEKGLQEYIEVAKEIKKKNKNVEFQILGSYEEDKYKSIISELEKKEIVKYLGVSSDIREQVKKIDCVINPSWHEGMSNVLLEAGAMKKFLIASEIPGCREIVKDETTGFTFEVKNSQHLMEKVEKYLLLPRESEQKMIENLYNHIKENFDREKVIKEYINVINGGENVKAVFKRRG